MTNEHKKERKNISLSPLAKFYSCAYISTTVVNSVLLDTQTSLSSGLAHSESSGSPNPFCGCFLRVRVHNWNRHTQKWAESPQQVTELRPSVKAGLCLIGPPRAPSRASTRVTPFPFPDFCLLTFTWQWLCSQSPLGPPVPSEGSWWCSQWSG